MAKTQQTCKVAYDSPANLSKDAVVRFTKKTKTKFIKRFALTEQYTVIGNLNPGTLIGYIKNDIPISKIGCLETECTLSGTNYSTQTGLNVHFNFLADTDFTEVTELDFYVYVPANGIYDVTLNLANIGGGWGDLTGYHNLKVTANNGAGWYPVVVDLTQPSSISGTGYIPSMQGAIVNIQLTGLVGDTMGVSSLTVRESVEDLRCEYIVKATCLSGLELNPEVAYTDSSCYGKKATDLTVSGSFTAKMLENNFFGIYNGVEVENGDFYTFKTINEVAITSTTINNQTYGLIDLADFEGDKCSLTELILSICVDGQKGKRMNKLCIQDFSQDMLSTEDYVILSTDNGATRDGQIIVDSSLIGQSVCISYPVLETGTQYSFTDELTDDVVSAIFLDKTNAGKKYSVEISKMHITTMPLSLTNDTNESEIQISFVLSKDDDNKFFKVTYFND